MKTTMERAVRGETGAALVLTLILILVGGLIAGPLLGLMGTGLMAGEVYERRTVELYAADAGVEDAIWKIMNPESSGLPPIPCGDKPWDEPYEYQISVDGRTVSVSIEYLTEDRYGVTSQATDAEGSITNVESCIFFGSQWRSLLDYGIIALNGDIVITGTSTLDSYPEANNTHIYANGSIIVDGTSEVRGAATATGSITYKAGAISPGPVTEYLHPPIEFHLPDTSLYWEAANAGELIEGNLAITASRTLGPARITGDLSLTSSAILTLGGPVWVEGSIYTAGGSRILGHGPLVAEGSVEVQGSAEPTTQKMPVVISLVDNEAMELPFALAFAGNTDSYMVLYAPYGLVDISGSGAVNGAIIGKNVTIRISAKCTAVYDLEVVERVRVKEITVLSWVIDLE
jgi:hypothetical protein